MSLRKITATWTGKGNTVLEYILLTRISSSWLIYSLWISDFKSLICFSYIASTHALVHFLSDDTIVIVPLKRVKQIDNEVLREGGKCRVKWNDGVEYDATIQAIGM